MPVHVLEGMLYKGVVFPLESELPPEARLLLEEFRLAVNGAVRAGIQTRVTSRNALVKMAYKGFRQEHPAMYAQHLVSPSRWLRAFSRTIAGAPGVTPAQGPRMSGD